VARIILIDDSPSARTVIGKRLRDHGWDVMEAPDATTGAELAMRTPPDAVVTDLWMPGISGLQLCRLLRAEPGTSTIPVILLTGSDDRRTRFWAKRAGAAAYVTKTESDRLVAILDEIARSTPPTVSSPSIPVPSARPTRSVHERLSQLLDAALYESTIAGEARALALHDSLETVFTELTRLTSDVVSYRWLALATAQSQRLLLHAAKGARTLSEREARDAVGLREPPEERRKSVAPRELFLVEDGRPLGGEGATPPLVTGVRFGDATLGTLAIAPNRRGASIDDRRLLAIVSAELGGPLRMVSLISEARRLASTDSLTGLMNRRAFLEAIAAEAKKSDKNMFPWSLLLLDVDHFKRVNDRWGHDAGDAVLRGVAGVLARIARKTDFVARWGGEEFVIALVATADAGARVAGERVRRAIAEARYALPSGGMLGATASIGLASALAPEWNLDELIARADRAMYNAKNRGRNRVETA
jgi:two-component system cell cycle response regulator